MSGIEDTTASDTTNKSQTDQTGMTSEANEQLPPHNDTKFKCTGSSETATTSLDRACHKTNLLFDIKPTQWPIVYSPDYNIGFFGLESLHPFDSGKWGKVFLFLKEEGMVTNDTVVHPNEASTDDLLVVHTKKYLDDLKWSSTVARITEVPPVALLPNIIVQKRVLRPLRMQTGGTILAGSLAMDRGWAINIGGGFHHCSSERGGGFCAYADITLAIKFLLERERVKKVMIVDLDAHQGNGHERDFMKVDDVYILDIFNRNIYPHDGFAKGGIQLKGELDFDTEDKEFLTVVEKHLTEALNVFTPDLIVYNAGTDILEGDPLGALSITPQGIIKRDQIVFEMTRNRPDPIPILMVTSGGYQKNNARIIADSILNLRDRGLITPPQAEENPSSQAAQGSQEDGTPTHTGGLFASLWKKMPSW